MRRSLRWTEHAVAQLEAVAEYVTLSSPVYAEQLIDRLNEPTHVHVGRDRESCKFWIEPLALAASRGFSAKELNRIRTLIVDHHGVIRNAWSRHCGRT